MQGRGSPLPTHLSRSSSASTELRSCRLTCVTRARMSLPGKDAASSLQRARAETVDCQGEAGPRGGWSPCKVGYF